MSVERDDKRVATLSDEEILSAAVTAADNLDATRVSELRGKGWHATTIFEGDTGLIRLGRLVEKAVLAKQSVTPSAIQDIAARRYERLRILGCAPMDTDHLERGEVMRFTNLDEWLDHDLMMHPSRGEATAAPSHVATTEYTKSAERVSQHAATTEGDGHTARSSSAPPNIERTSPNGMWVVWYEDKAVPPEVFFGEGAEANARLRFKQASDNWSCHLLSRVPTQPLPEADLYARPSTEDTKVPLLDSPHPRTDALEEQLGDTDNPWGQVNAYIDLARQLERELAAMTKLNRIHVQQLDERSSTPRGDEAVRQIIINLLDPARVKNGLDREEAAAVIGNLILERERAAVSATAVQFVGVDMASKPDITIVHDGKGGNPCVLRSGCYQPMKCAGEQRCCHDVASTDGGGQP